MEKAEIISGGVEAMLPNILKFGDLYDIIYRLKCSVKSTAHIDILSNISIFVTNTPIIYEQICRYMTIGENRDGRYEELRRDMLVKNSTSHEIPTMKPLDMEKKAEKPVEAPAAAPAAEEKIDFSKVEIEPLFADFVDFETFSKSDFRAVKVLNCEAVKKSKKLLKFTLDDGTGTDRVILSGIHEYYEPEELVGKTCIAITNLPPRAMMGIDSCCMLISAVHHENGEEKLHLLMVDPHIPAGAKLY